MEQNKNHIFTVEAEVCLGFTCGGASVCETGEATLELTDEELQSLIKLINESGTSDVGQMKLKKRLPEIYDKLDEASCQAASNAEEDHWLEYGWENPDVFRPSEHMEFGEKELGYKFEYDENDFLDEDGILDEDDLEEAKMEDFCEWLTKYKDSLNDEERRKFMRQFVEVDLQGVEYNVQIPEEILVLCDICREE